MHGQQSICKSLTTGPNWGRMIKIHIQVLQDPQKELPGAQKIYTLKSFIRCGLYTVVLEY